LFVIFYISNAYFILVQFWNELKNNEKDTYNFFEFIEQYEDVWNDTQQKFLGIGVAIKKCIK
jgi:hypothetical protein